ncbi:MAG: 6,7-dimethyl-8-ribityllumazine synthase [Candidatus Pelagibacter sp.]|nr:6,7-dimethyl-8-ribityllumazine synthase [Candidatus Pelagibacter sp.]|tara:strand:+ start:111 stop:551 length:441 start_codon:yes stop_codon:yes gene_type:complete
MNKKILIICANYYPELSSILKSNAEVFLKKEKIKSKCVYVPGIFEIPVIIARNIKKFDGFLALGCVIKGETPHFDYISRSTFDALMKLSIDYKKPIGNGIITALNKLQAIQRSGNDSSSKVQKKIGKGAEAAKAVLAVLKNGPKKS